MSEEKVTGSIRVTEDGYSSRVLEKGENAMGVDAAEGSDFTVWTIVDKLGIILRSPLAKLTCELNPPEGYEPCVTFSPGEGVDFGYVNDDDDYIEAGIWPFDREFIWVDDCERLGIRWEVV